MDRGNRTASSPPTVLRPADREAGNLVGEEVRLIVVLIAALPRLGPLSDLLDSLAAVRLPVGYGLHTVVVDNGRVRSVPDTRPGVTVVHEPVAGIVTARNRSIEAALPLHPWAVAIVDDDEVVSPDWLLAMVAAQSAYGADIVTGPVEFVLPPGRGWTPALEQRFLKPAKPLGPYPGSVATNNVLVLAHWFGGPSGFRFDPAFNATGGEDVDLFRRMRASGAAVVWSPLAGVTEFVPQERASPQALRRRAKRNGQLEVRLVLAAGTSSRGRLILRAVHLGARSTVRFAVLGLLVARHRELGRIALSRAVGQWRAAVGLRQFEEYRRSDADDMCTSA